MTVETAIYARLSGFAGLTALVATRIYPVKAPQAGARPFVVYSRVSGQRVTAMGADTGIARPRYQFDAYGDTYASARAVGDQVRLALQRFRGTLSGTEILDCFIESDLDLYEDDALPAALFRASLDLEINHRE